jgi:DNA-binding transcriptional MocR family regulator
MTHLLQTGQLQDHIKHTLQPAYATNYRALHDTITTHLLPLGFTLPQPTRKFVGGFFVWLSLPESLAAGEFARACKEEEGVIVAPGAMFEVPGDEAVKFDGNVRLCFAWEEEHRLVEGVRRMKAAAEKVMAGGSRTGSGEYVFIEKKDVGGVDEFK